MKLGQPVAFKAYLERRFMRGSSHFINKRYWYVETLDEPLHGILIGLRTISDGELHNLGEDGLMYKATEWFKAALIVTDLRTKPKLVFLSDIVETYNAELTGAAHRDAKTER